MLRAPFFFEVEYFSIIVVIRNLPEMQSFTFNNRKQQQEYLQEIKNELDQDSLKRITKEIMEADSCQRQVMVPSLVLFVYDSEKNEYSGSINTFTQVPQQLKLHFKDIQSLYEYLRNNCRNNLVKMTFKGKMLIDYARESILIERICLENHPLPYEITNLDDLWDHIKENWENRKNPYYNQTSELYHPEIKRNTLSIVQQQMNQKYSVKKSTKHYVLNVEHNPVINQSSSDKNTPRKRDNRSSSEKGIAFTRSNIPIINYDAQTGSHVMKIKNMPLRQERDYSPVYKQSKKLVKNQENSNKKYKLTKNHMFDTDIQRSNSFIHKGLEESLRQIKNQLQIIQKNNRDSLVSIQSRLQKRLDLITSTLNQQFKLILQQLQQKNVNKQVAHSQSNTIKQDFNSFPQPFKIPNEKFPLQGYGKFYQQQYQIQIAKNKNKSKNEIQKSIQNAWKSLNPSQRQSYFYNSESKLEFKKLQPNQNSESHEKNKQIYNSEQQIKQERSHRKQFKKRQTLKGKKAGKNLQTKIETAVHSQTESENEQEKEVVTKNIGKKLGKGKLSISFKASN